MSPVWAGSDAADLPRLIDTHVCGSGGFASNIGELFLYRLGGIQPVFLYLEMVLCRLLHVRVGEKLWELPTLLAGLGAVFAGYRIGEKLGGMRAAVATGS